MLRACHPLAQTNLQLAIHASSRDYSIKKSPKSFFRVFSHAFLYHNSKPESFPKRATTDIYWSVCCVAHLNLPSPVSLQCWVRRAQFPIFAPVLVAFNLEHGRGNTTTLAHMATGTTSTAPSLAELHWPCSDHHHLSKVRLPSEQGVARRKLLNVACRRRLRSPTRCCFFSRVRLLSDLPSTPTTTTTTTGTL